MKKNSTYIKNTEKGNLTLKKRTESAIKEKVNPTPCDLILSRIVSKYSKSNHIVLKAPGRHIKQERTKNSISDGSKVNADAVMRIGLEKYKSFEEVAVLIEYLTSKAKYKAPDILKYNVSVTSDLELPCINLVVTNLNPGCEEETFIVDEVPVHILYRVFDKKVTEKLLNTLTEKDYHKEKIIEEEFVKFLYVIAFSKDEYAKEHIERSVELYTCIEKIDPKHKMDLFKAIKEKVKYHYQDDLSQKRRLLEMAILATEDVILDELTRVEQMEYEYEKELEYKDNVINNIINEKDNIINEKDNVINEKENIINEKDKIIFMLKKEIETLKSAKKKENKILS